MEPYHLSLHYDYLCSHSVLLCDPTASATAPPLPASRVRPSDHFHRILNPHTDTRTHTHHAPLLSAMSSAKPVDPRRRALQQNAGSQIMDILNPIRPVPKGAKVPNHALVNRQNLKATQVRNQLKRAEDSARAAEEPFKMQRFKNVDSVVRQRTEDAAAGSTHTFTRKGEGKGIVAKLGAINIK